MNRHSEPPFEKVLSVSMEDIRMTLRAMDNIPWADFLLNPRRLGGRDGLKKAAVLPTIIIKEEDRAPLKNWPSKRKIPIHVWHAFFDEAFGISFANAERLFSRGDIEPTEQVFQAPGGATTKKVIYKIYYRHAYPLATTVEEPQLVANSITDKNGHILPYVRFVGGKSRLSEEALSVLDSIK